jgi:hypothetical protein
MKACCYWLSCVVMLAVVSAGVLSPNWALVAGKHLPGDDELRELIEKETQRKASLCAQDGIALARLRERHAIAEDVISGRQTLAQAAVHFVRLNKTDLGCMKGVRVAFPGGSDAECVCKHVIDCVRVVLEDRGEPCEVVLNQLHRELRRLLECPGSLTLPDTED